MTMYIYCVWPDIAFNTTLHNYFQTSQRHLPLYLTNIHSLVIRLSLHVRPKCSVGRWNFLQGVKFLEFGFPINCQGNCSDLSSERNHTGAKHFPDKMEKYLKMECTYGAIIWPFFKNPFKTDMVISPLNSVPKKESEDRRIILDSKIIKFAQPGD